MKLSGMLAIEWGWELRWILVVGELGLNDFFLSTSTHKVCQLSAEEYHSIYHLKGFGHLGSHGTIFGKGLFQNMFQNLLINTNNKFCFGYIALFCFFETFPDGSGRPVGRSNFNDYPFVDFD